MSPEHPLDDEIEVVVAVQHTDELFAAESPTGYGTYEIPYAFTLYAYHDIPVGMMSGEHEIGVFEMGEGGIARWE